MWEPYKIAIGAFYALCLQKAFDTAITFFQAHPIYLRDPRAALTVTPEQGVTALQLGAYIIWVSIYFLHNGRLYFQLSPHPPRRRIMSHGIMTAGFALFYFFGATLGNPGRQQLVLIAAIMVTDMIFPANLAEITRLRARLLWAARGVTQLAFVAFLILHFDDEQLADIWWAVALFALLVLQLLIIGPWEGRFQRVFADTPPSRGQVQVP